MLVDVRADARAAVTGVPQWFAAGEDRVFGWVHEPASGTARAAVVVCPAMGQESNFSHYLLRTLAIDLASAGFLVVRFDWPGSGDSTGHASDPARLAAWDRAQAAAVDLARSRTDAPLVLAGMRVGALLALQHARHRDDVDGLLLWDVPKSGRALLRELRTRHNIAVGEGQGGMPGLTVLGTSFSDETIADLSALDATAQDVLPAERALLVVRPGRATLPEDTPTRSDRTAQTLVAPDQEALLLQQTLPLETLGAVESWLEKSYVATHPVAAQQDDQNDICKCLYNSECKCKCFDNAMF